SRSAALAARHCRVLSLHRGTAHPHPLGTSHREHFVRRFPPAWTARVGPLTVFGFFGTTPVVDVFCFLGNSRPGAYFDLGQLPPGTCFVFWETPVGGFFRCRPYGSSYPCPSRFGRTAFVASRHIRLGSRPLARTARGARVGPR